MDNEACCKILIVDDNKADGTFVRHCILDSLKSCTPAIECVLSYEEALSRIENTGFNVLLVDYRLGGRDGIELLEEIRGRGITTPAIFLTAYSDFDVVVKAMRAGATDYLVKGKFSEELLCQSIRYALKLDAQGNEKKQVEEKLRKSEDLIKRILEAIKVGITLGTESGAFTLFNPEMERLTGYSSEEVFSCGDILDRLCFTPIDLRAFRKALREVLENGAVQSVAVEIRKKDNSVRTLLVSISPFVHEGSRLLLCAYSDITDQKWVEKKLKDSIGQLLRSEHKLVSTLSDLEKAHEELKASQFQLIQAEKWESVGHLAAGVAHEVKNPLAILVQALDCLESLVPPGDAEIKSVLETMKDALHRADEPIRGLLDFASLSAMTLEERDLHAIIESSLLLVKHPLEKNRVAAEKAFYAGPLRISADKARLEQVFVNLFLNAVYAMPEGGTITVRTGIQENGNGLRQVFVRVEDTGSGVPPDILDKIFDPFITTRQNKGGTGLGLSIVKNIVEMHRGKAIIENRKEGGARVILLFPLEPESEMEERP